MHNPDVLPDSTPDHPPILGCLLEDGQGQVQALVSAETLVDLAALNRGLNRNLHAATASFNQPLAMDSLAALPRLPGVQLVVDARLVSGQPITLSPADSRVPTISDFSIPVATLAESLDHGGDRQRIEKSIKSFTPQRIKGRLEDTIDLPPLPATAHRILQLLANPDANIEELVNVVEMDPSLAAQVIAWAQSPYYNAPGQVHSIHEAVVRVLGYDLVMNLSLGLALSKTLQLPKDGIAGNLSFWEQSVYCAALVEGLVRLVPARKRPPIGMAYLAGLLHNFGYLLLAEVFPPHFASFCRYMEVNRHLHHYEVEQFLLQTNREQMGFWLMNTWGLPEEVCLAIRYQNHPGYKVSSNSKADVLAKMLFIATRLLRRYQPTDISPESIPDTLLNELHIDSDRLDEMGEAVFGKQEQLQTMARQLTH